MFLLNYKNYFCSIHLNCIKNVFQISLERCINSGSSFGGKPHYIVTSFYSTETSSESIPCHRVKGSGSLKITFKHRLHFVHPLLCLRDTHYYYTKRQTLRIETPLNEEAENVSSITWEIAVRGYALKIGKENCSSRFQITCLIPSRTDIFPDMHIFLYQPTEAILMYP